MKVKTKKKRPSYSTAMVVDDQQVDLFIVEKQLQLSAIVGEVLKFSMPSEALAMLKNPGSRPFPELIVLDMIMPVIDGHGFLTELVKIPVFNPKKCKVMLLSAYMDCHEGTEINEVASSFHFIDRCYPKPFSHEMLYSLN
jgi:CheY-like chemotaxis protein